MSSSRFLSSILAASGASLLPTLCSAADTRLLALFIPTPLSFAFLHIWFTPSQMSPGSGASLSAILPLTASTSL